MWNTQGPPYLWSIGNTAILLSWEFLCTIQNTIKMVRGPQTTVGVHSIFTNTSCPRACIISSKVGKNDGCTWDWNSFQWGKNHFFFFFLIYHIDTKQHANFQQPSVNLTKYQKGVYYLRVKVFNMLPTNIKIESDNTKKFRLVLLKILYENSFYSMDKYFEL
jgi:hypothetical protein